MVSFSWRPLGETDETEVHGCLLHSAVPCQVHLIVCSVSRCKVTNGRRPASHRRQHEHIDAVIDGALERFGYLSSAETAGAGAAYSPGRTSPDS